MVYLFVSFNDLPFVTIIMWSVCPSDSVSMTYLSFLDFLIIGFLALPAAFTLTPLWFEQGDGQIKGEELPSDVSI